MYNVLVVDDDSTCLVILKGYLKRWNYEVTAVKHAYDALCTLRAKPFDIVLSDVHMPNMDGFELQRHINNEFRLPVILISSDSLAEMKGIQNGAQLFLVKPIEPRDVKDVWQFSEWWKINMKNKTPRIREINTSTQENIVGNVAVSSVDVSAERNKKFVWSSNLHTRFVEAVLLLGYNRAVPKNILEVMNEPELTREQVASHLQKYRKFLARILDGSVVDMENSQWIDYNYYSTTLCGNPHLILINQIIGQYRTGKLAATIPAGNLCLTPGGYRPLPPYTPAEASATRNMNAMWVPNNFASSSVNLTAGGFSSTSNANMGNHVGSSTISNPVQNLSYEPHQMGHYKKNMLVAPNNYSYGNGGLVGRANNNMIPSANHIGTSSTVPIHNNFYSNQSPNLGGQDSRNLLNGHNINGGQLRIVQHEDPNTGISSGANQFGNTSVVNKQQLGAGQMSDQNLFNGHNSNGGQLRIVQHDPNTGISSDANQFRNTSVVNEQQLGSGQMADQNLFNGHNSNGDHLTELGGVQCEINPSISFGATNQFGNTSAVNEQQLGVGEMTNPKTWSNNNEVLSPDNSLAGLNFIQGDDGEDIWGDIMNTGVANDKDVGVGNGKDGDQSKHA